MSKRCLILLTDYGITATKDFTTTVDSITINSPLNKYPIYCYCGKPIKETGNHIHSLTNKLVPDYEIFIISCTNDCYKRVINNEAFLQTIISNTFISFRDPSIFK